MSPEYTERAVPPTAPFEDEVALGARRLRAPGACGSRASGPVAEVRGQEIGTPALPARTDSVRKRAYRRRATPLNVRIVESRPARIR